MEKEVLMYDDPKCAVFVTNISGWIDKNQRFFGNSKQSEDMARYSSCTHKRCSCGKIMSKHYTKCPDCSLISVIERYNKLPFEEWDGKELVYSELAERYFNDSDEIEEYCEEEGVDSKDLRLLLCTPNYFRVVENDLWDDVLPEESDGELPDKLINAIEALNEVIKSLPAASYSPSNTRTEYISILDENI